MESSTMKPTSWRSLIKVHPAADLFPMMSPEELRVLGEDIKANGLYHSIQMLSGAVIDGRNRLDAMELIGLELRFPKRDNRFTGQIWADGGVIGHCHHNTPIDIPQPYAYVISANIHRRHLTTAQKSELIAKLLKADPTKSDRAVAEVVKVDHKTVGAKRAALSSTGEIPQLDAPRVGADGKTRKLPAKSAENLNTSQVASPDPRLAATAPEPVEPRVLSEDEQAAFMRAHPNIMKGSGDINRAFKRCSPEERQFLCQYTLPLILTWFRLEDAALAGLAPAPDQADAAE